MHNIGTMSQAIAPPLTPPLQIYILGDTLTLVTPFKTNNMHTVCEQGEELTYQYR